MRSMLTLASGEPCWTRAQVALAAFSRSMALPTRSWLNVALIQKSSTCSGVRTTARSEEHTSELQSLMRISYAVFCLKKKRKQDDTQYITTSSEYYKNRY